MQRLKPVTQEEWLLCNEFNRNLKDEYIANSTELSEKSRKSYASSLQIWFNWVRKYCDNIEHIKIKSRDFLRYQNYLIGKGHGSCDIKNKRSTVSALNNYIMLYYEDIYPTFKNFINKGIKSPEKSFVNEKIPPTKSEMEMLYAKLEKMEEWQKIAYLKYTFDTSCRRAESRQLLKEVVNYSPVVKTIKVKNPDGVEEEKTSTYYITHKVRCKGKGKTGVIRKFKVCEDTMNALKKWIEIRGEDDCEYMFVTRRNNIVNQVSENTFNQWSKNLFSKIIGRRFHPHILREGRATSLVVEDGKDIEAARKLLGHKSVETTQIYVIRDDEDDIDDLYVD